MEGVDDSLVSETESSMTARPPIAEVVAPAAFRFAAFFFFAFLFPAELLRDGSASVSGDDAAAPVEDAEDAEPCEEPRVLFALFFLLGAAGGAVVGACCSPVAACCCSLAERLSVVVDPCTGGGGNAGVSERLAISSAIVSAVGAAAAVARGTSTKSAVSDRGDWRGGDVERKAEEERDQTISSSSERESLAHRELLEVSERTSRDEESEVDILERSAGGRWGNGTEYLFDRAEP